ncbi:6-bladed beta-propeller [Flavihumibacter solisilvae]|uniref:Peptidylglycine monooxygenase n=1 Tax=Flavihumibacter solisilvae TaxID=1349421 RepID=A0A0C1ISQ8_9BACT|nr:6-bladed beta-propeller [Flavihumibacter solisilvae]KIC93474.1 peptidylglycine monooxygenase [Flavihumibacter solisilvae]
MNRRGFIRNSSLVMAGTFVDPSAFFSGKETIGHGKKKYRIDTAWSKADAGRNPVNDCHEMVQDSKGRILLLTNETKNNVLIYSKKGKLLSTWGNSYPGAHGLTIFNENGTDVLFICDNNRHQVIKTTIDGRELMVLDYPKESGLYTKAEEYVPTETAIAPNGDIYVADGYGKDYILRYDASGRYLGHFGGKGSEPSNLLNAHGIALDARDKNNPTLIATSRMENAFKRYDLMGKYLGTIAMPGAWVCRPVIHGDNLYAAVLQSNDRQWKQSGFITILDKSDKVISNPGGTEPAYTGGTLQNMGQSSAIFSYPHDVCVDDDENLYVAQWNSGKVYPYKLSLV